jgi:acyl-CoA synthetase (AMP-forming)/AMP-acid ligase II
MAALITELHPSPTPSRLKGELADLIAERASSRGGHPYLEYARSDSMLSFRDLLHAVEGWAGMLDSAAVRPGSTVGLVIADPIAFSIGFLGTVASGHWAAPLDPYTPAAGMDASIVRVGADIVFSDQPMPTGLSVKWVDLEDAPAPARGAVVRPADETPSDLPSGGAVLASSGTTGAPKVVPLHQSRLLHTARSVRDHHRITSSDRGFNSLPLFHINAEVVGLMATLVAGSSLVLDDRFHRTRFWSVMAERRITWINAVPAIISRLADPGDDEVIPSEIRFIRSASAPLPVATSTRFEANTGIPVVETYGMTEAASQITANPVDGPRKPGSVGLPVGVEVRVLVGDAATDEALPQQVPGGNVGHVEIRGPSVITAYAGRHHADRIDGDGWLRTGDLGHFDEDGYLYLDSRTDDVINRGGEKVFPREIEEMILVDADVTGVAVVGASDPELGQVPVAYLVLQGVHDSDDCARAAEVAARVRDHLSAALVRSKRPVWMCVLSALPAGATGKVQRRALRDDDLPVIYRLDCR